MNPTYLGLIDKINWAVTEILILKGRLNGVQNQVTSVTQGTVTLSSGAATVSTASVTATSNILLTAQNCSSCGALNVGTITPGVSFTIHSTNGSDASNVLWVIVNGL